MKKTGIFISFLLVFVVDFYLSGQQNYPELPITFGVKAGLSMPQLQGGTTEQSKGYKSIMASDLGVFVSVLLSGHLRGQAEVWYAGQGGVKSGMQAISADGYQFQIPSNMNLYADFKNEAIMKYIEVPLLLRFDMPVSGRSALYADFGPYFGFLLDAKTRTSGTSLLYTDKNGTPLSIPGYPPLPAQDFGNTTNIKSDLHPVNFGINGGIGLSLKFGPGHLLVDSRASYGLTNIQKSAANGKNNTGALVLCIGYEIGL